MNELMPREIVESLATSQEAQASAMRTLAFQMTALTDKVSELERMVRRLEKLSPAQVTELNKLVRDKTDALCREYRIEGHERTVNARIRAAIKAEYGGSVKDVSREDWDFAKQFVLLWDDARYLRGLRGK